MTTFVNTPAPASNNTGTFIGVTVLIALGLIFVYFGLPALRNVGTPQINLPAPVINMPDKVDVNVQQTP